MADDDREILRLLQESLDAPRSDDEPALLTPDERRRQAAMTLYEHERAAVQQAVTVNYLCQLAGLTEAETEVIADKAEEDAYTALGFDDDVDDAVDDDAGPPQ